MNDSSSSNRNKHSKASTHCSLCRKRTLAALMMKMCKCNYNVNNKHMTTTNTTATTEITTIAEFIRHTYPADVAEKAIERAFMPSCPQDKEDLTLIRAFVWSNTPEGSKYWSNMFAKYELGVDTVTLTNGKVVANFSSPHPFTFEDGTVLPARSKEDAERLKVDFNEDIHTNGDVELTFSLSDAVKEEMEKYIKAQEYGCVDVVLCPLPMITAIKEEYGRDWLKKSPFRAVRICNRIDKLVSIDKQCL